MSSVQTQKAGYEIRISEDLSEGEQTATASRRRTVQKGLQKFKIECNESEVPNIAVLGSGGGLRAMIALYGTLIELKKCGLLDCVMYLGGVSGSTWCMSNLYANEDWGKNIKNLVEEQCKRLVKGTWDVWKAMDAGLKAAEDEHYSLTDFWAYFVVYKMLKELNESKLSDHQTSCESGKDPYPIYAAVDKDTYSEYKAGSWIEFTPHEVGFTGVGGSPGIGAYVDMKYLGSEFKEGKLCKQKEEKSIAYLRGLWGSALGSMKEIVKTILDFLLDLLSWHKHEHCPLPKKEHQSCHMLTKLYEYALRLQLHASDESASPAMDLFKRLENTLKSHKNTRSYEEVRKARQAWPTADARSRQEECLKLCKIFLSDFGDWLVFISKTNYCVWAWAWGDTSNFLHESDINDPDLKKKEVVSLIDAGLAINSAYPLVLHPKRKVKLILSFDFSSGNPFETVDSAEKYCKVHGIKFPKFEDPGQDEKDNPLNCYIYKGEGPTVMHFPLFNTGNCPGKIDKNRRKFSTIKMSYSCKEIGKLLDLAKKNVRKVQQKIKEEIESIVASSSQGV